MFFRRKVGSNGKSVTEARNAEAWRKWDAERNPQAIVTPEPPQDPKRCWVLPAGTKKEQWVEDLVDFALKFPYEQWCEVPNVAGNQNSHGKCIFILVRDGFA